MPVRLLCRSDGNLSNDRAGGFALKWKSRRPPPIAQVSHTTPRSAFPGYAGISFNVTLTAHDQNKKQLMRYCGTVTMTSSDSRAILPGRHTFKSTCPHTTLHGKSDHTQQWRQSSPRPLPPAPGH